jgi:hypothetical protein
VSGLDDIMTLIRSHRGMELSKTLNATSIIVNSLRATQVNDEL